MRTHLILGLAVFLAAAADAPADIFRWDNGALIPGTEDITPGPGVSFFERDLQFAEFSGADLVDAQFLFGPLDSARFTGANLSNSVFPDIGTLFRSLSAMDVDMSGANLSGAALFASDFRRANFRDANLSRAGLQEVWLLEADFGGAIVEFTRFSGVFDFTEAQLASTASYQAKNLRGIGFESMNLSGWNFKDQNLAGANFFLSNLANTDLSGAVVEGARLYRAVSKGFTEAQLALTASYQAKDLRGILLGENDLTGWNFAGQNLARADLAKANLTNADLRGANLADAHLATAVMTGAMLAGADMRAVAGWDGNGVLGNTIEPNGVVRGLTLGAGQRLQVRDDDGVPNDPGKPYWAVPREPIPVKIEDNLSMTVGGVLQLTFDADPWDSLISFEAGIPVELGGTLELSFADDVDAAAQIGRTLRVFDWTGVAPLGQFLLAHPPTDVWDATRLYSHGEVTLTAFHPYGDINRDGLLDNEDIQPFIAALVGGGDPLGDLSGDGNLDNEDIPLFVESLLGGSAAAAVPEPASAGLFAAGSLAMLAVRGRRARGG